MAAMPRYALEALTAPSGRLLAESGVPEVFEPFVEREWCSAQNGLVWHVGAQSRTYAEWLRLGGVLTDQLLASAERVGSLLDGEWPLALISQLLEQASESDGVGSIAVHWTSERHPAGFAFPVRNVTWCGVHDRESARWLQGLWALTGT